MDSDLCFLNEGSLSRNHRLRIALHLDEHCLKALLGIVLLENRPDVVWCSGLRGSFNDAVKYVLSSRGKGGR